MSLAWLTMPAGYGSDAVSATRYGAYLQMLCDHMLLDDALQHLAHGLAGTYASTELFQRILHSDPAQCARPHRRPVGGASVVRKCRIPQAAKRRHVQDEQNAEQAVLV